MYVCLVHVCVCYTVKHKINYPKLKQVKQRVE